MPELLYNPNYKPTSKNIVASVLDDSGGEAFGER